MNREKTLREKLSKQISEEKIIALRLKGFLEIFSAFKGKSLDEIPEGYKKMIVKVGCSSVEECINLIYQNIAYSNEQISTLLKQYARLKYN